MIKYNLFKKMAGALILTSLSTLVFAYVEGSGAPNLSDDEYKNLPKADSGIQIVSYSELSHGGYPPIDGIERHAEQQKNGFIKLKSEDATSLLMLNKNSKNFFYDNNKPYDTHMKSNLDQITLAFPFKAISFVNDTDLIGFVPEGGWDNGWTGVVEFFAYQAIGKCKYIKHNLKISHGGAKLAKELVTYDINEKPTLIVVEGQLKEGFSYKIKWFDDIFYHTLICASKDFSKNKTIATVELAKRIDIDQS